MGGFVTSSMKSPASIRRIAVYKPETLDRFDVASRAISRLNSLARMIVPQPNKGLQGCQVVQGFSL